MKIVNFYDKINFKTAICLGGFDSLHLGHKKIINDAKQFALKNNVECAIITFTNFIKGGLYDRLSVFTFDERLEILQKLGVDLVIKAQFDDNFLKISHNDFLHTLLNNFNPTSLFCGEDFKYGFNAEGNIHTLNKFCKDNELQLFVRNFELDSENNKIATKTIKNLIAQGNIVKINRLLCDNYFISGVVEKGRQVGNKIGFPTANITLSGDKFPLKEGVYKTHCFIDGVKYNCITNCGKAPTFGFNYAKIESYIDNYSGDLYGKKLNVYFDDFIRNIIKFESVDSLICQLKKDLKVIR